MQTTLTRRKRNEWNIMENKRESSKTKKKNILFSMMFFLRARFVFFAYDISTFFRIHLNGTNKERKMIGNWQKIWTRGIVQRYSMRVNSWALGQAVTSFGLCYVLIGDWQHSNENGNKNGVRERERKCAWFYDGIITNKYRILIALYHAIHFRVFRIGKLNCWLQNDSNFKYIRKANNIWLPLPERKYFRLFHELYKIVQWTLRKWWEQLIKFAHQMM